MWGPSVGGPLFHIQRRFSNEYSQWGLEQGREWNLGGRDFHTPRQQREELSTVWKDYSIPWHSRKGAVQSGRNRRGGRLAPDALLWGKASDHQRLEESDGKKHLYLGRNVGVLPSFLSGAAGTSRRGKSLGRLSWVVYRLAGISGEVFSRGILLSLGSREFVGKGDVSFEDKVLVEFIQA